MKKKILSIILAIVMIAGMVPMSVSVLAITSADGIGYKISDGCAIIIDYLGDSDSFVIPEKIEGYPVTAIGNWAFSGCEFVSVTLPKTVSEIGEGAFNECSNLVSFTVPEGVKFIDDNAFAKCKSLENISIPASVSSIGDEAFYCCTALNTVNYGADARAWERVSVGTENDPLLGAEFIFTEVEYEIPAGLTYVINDGEVTITGYTGSAQYLVIPEKIEGYPVTVIGFKAFYNCAGLVNVDIPESVYKIDNMAFYGCTSLDSIAISKNVTEINYMAFNNCTALEAVYIEDIEAWCNIYFASSSTNPLSFAKHLYINGELAREIVIPESITAIDDYTFYNSSVEKVTVMGEITSVGKMAFAYCTSLESIELFEKGVTSIGNHAFYGCTALKGIVIPEGIETIGEYTFGSCTSLESVIIPEGVKSIGNFAFEYCIALREITIPKTVLSIGFGAFSNCRSLETVNYNGSEEDFANITIDADNTRLTDARIVYASFGAISGDINGDGAVNTMDANLMKRILAGVLTPSSEQMKACDLNGDGEINGFDSNIISRIIAGKN